MRKILRVPLTYDRLTCAGARRPSRGVCCRNRGPILARPLACRTSREGTRPSRTWRRADHGTGEDTTFFKLYFGAEERSRYLVVAYIAACGARLEQLSVFQRFLGGCPSAIRTVVALVHLLLPT